MEYKTFDNSLLFEQFRGDEEILLEVIAIFMEGHSAILASIEEAIDEKDAEKLRINAHTLKGVLGNFYAIQGSKTAHELEKCGIERNFQKTQEYFQSLLVFMKDFLFELETLKKSL